MIALLTSLWELRTTVAYALLGMAALAGWLYVRGLQDDVARLAGDVQTAEQAARHNAAAADAIRQDAERKLAVLAEERDALAERAARVVVIKEKISRAPQTEDGPVARVVCHALGGLWGPAAPAGDVCRASGGAAQPADLRAATGAAAR